MNEQYFIDKLYHLLINFLIFKKIIFLYIIKEKNFNFRIVIL